MEGGREVRREETERGKKGGEVGKKKGGIGREEKKGGGRER